jgi:hypothetical protein
MVETSAKLTKRTVDSAVPKQGRYILWDTELKGFALRVAEAEPRRTYFATALAAPDVLVRDGSWCWDATGCLRQTRPALMPRPFLEQ